MQTKEELNNDFKLSSEDVAFILSKEDFDYSEHEVDEVYINVEALGESEVEEMFRGSNSSYKTIENFIDFEGIGNKLLFQDYRYVVLPDGRIVAFYV